MAKLWRDLGAARRSSPGLKAGARRGGPMDLLVNGSAVVEILAGEYLFGAPQPLMASAAVTEGADTATATAKLAIEAAASLTEGADSVFATADLAITADAGIAEAGDIVGATASLAGETHVADAVITATWRAPARIDCLYQRAWISGVFAAPAVSAGYLAVPALAGTFLRPQIAATWRAPA